MRRSTVIAVAAAAGVLALSFLAFVHPAHGDGRGPGPSVASYAQSTEGLVNLADTDVGPAVDDCAGRTPGSVPGVGAGAQSAVLHALTGVLGAAPGEQGTTAAPDDEAVPPGPCTAAGTAG